MKTATARQLQVLEAVRDFIREHGFPPTRRELAPILGISYEGVTDHIEALERKGLIVKDFGRFRGIRLGSCALTALDAAEPRVFIGPRRCRECGVETFLETGCWICSIRRAS